MQFNLTQQEAAALINLLGNVPTNAGVYPVLVKQEQKPETAE